MGRSFPKAMLIVAIFLMAFLMTSSEGAGRDGPMMTMKVMRMMMTEKEAHDAVARLYNPNSNSHNGFAFGLPCISLGGGYGGVGQGGGYGGKGGGGVGQGGGYGGVGGFGGKGGGGVGLGGGYGGIGGFGGKGGGGVGHGGGYGGKGGGEEGGYGGNQGNGDENGSGGGYGEGAVAMKEYGNVGAGKSEKGKARVDHGKVAAAAP